MKNFHLPLPEQTYEQLRAAASRADVPATTLAREAIQDWLKAQARLKRSQEIAQFAAEHAGTALDLDPELEKLALDQLEKFDRKSR